MEVGGYFLLVCSEADRQRRCFTRIRPSLKKPVCGGKGGAASDLLDGPVLHLHATKAPKIPATTLSSKAPPIGDVTMSLTAAVPSVQCPKSLSHRPS